MNMPKEAGETARSAIDAMRGSPGLLSVIILQIITLTVLFFIAKNNADHRQVREMAMLEHCFANFNKEE